MVVGTLDQLRDFDEVRTSSSGVYLLVLYDRYFDNGPWIRMIMECRMVAWHGKCTSKLACAYPMNKPREYNQHGMNYRLDVYKSHWCLSTLYHNLEVYNHKSCIAIGNSNMLSRYLHQGT